MTTYTAADFAVSRFADFDTSDAIAMRSGSGRKPWVIPNGRVLSDAKMAADGWVPVREPSDLCICKGADDMTTERSTYTYEGGVQETVTLKRGPITPQGHAVLKIKPSIGPTVDCYVNTAWLRDRAEQLIQQRPEGAEDWEDWLIEAMPHESMPDEDIALLADRIAQRLNEERS